jgi:hypothetical protein
VTRCCPRSLVHSRCCPGLLQHLPPQVLSVLEGRWFLFDDKSVTPWDPANMEEQCFGGFAAEDPGMSCEGDQ